VFRDESNFPYGDGRWPQSSESNELVVCPDHIIGWPFDWVMAYRCTGENIVGNNVGIFEQNSEHCSTSRISDREHHPGKLR